MTERLEYAAIVRGGEIYSGHKSHAAIRRSLRDDEPYLSTPGDQEGFLTDEGRFVTREQAVSIGVSSGQLAENWLRGERVLLSSDVSWTGLPHESRKKPAE